VSWIKTHDDQCVNTSEIVRMNILQVSVCDETFRWVLVLHLKNGDDIIYAQSELLKDECFSDNYRPADAVRSKECRRDLLAQMDHLTKYELA